MDERQWHADLFARLAAGDEQALSELYDAYSSMVFGIAMHVTIDRAAAEDVVQDVFVQVWDRPDAFSPERGPLRSWLGTLAHRRAVDHVRHEASLRRRADMHAMEPPFGPSEPDLSGEEKAMLLAALGTLPTEQRVVIDLAYFQGRTFRQVATDLGIAEGTAKSRLRLALTRMERVLSKEVAR